MAVAIDIFNPQVSVIAHGLEGKTIMFYGGNNVGKTAQAVRVGQPYLFACENGLNGLSGVKYNSIQNWADFKKAVKQFTHKSTVDKAKVLYSTIIIDEVYASAMFCQDFVCQTYGNGAIDLGDTNADTKVNLYKLYEREYWKQINLLVNSGYTVIFIAHAAEEKNGYLYPKGDKKRCLAPIIDNCDIVAYIESNGVDEDKKVIKSSAYFAETKNFFARSRYPYMPTYIEEFTAENLEAAINDGIQKQAEAEKLETVSYDTQKQQNETIRKAYDELMEELCDLGQHLAENGHFEELQAIVEENLGAGKKATDLKKGQEQVIQVLIEELGELLKSVENN